MIERHTTADKLKPALIYIYAFGDVDEVAGRVTAYEGHIISIKTGVYPAEGMFIIFEDTEANKIAFVDLPASQPQNILPDLINRYLFSQPLPCNSCIYLF